MTIWCLSTPWTVAADGRELWREEGPKWMGRCLLIPPQPFVADTIAVVFEIRFHDTERRLNFPRQVPIDEGLRLQRVRRQRWVDSDGSLWYRHTLVLVAVDRGTFRIGPLQLQLVADEGPPILVTVPAVPVQVKALLPDDFDTSQLKPPPPPMAPRWRLQPVLFGLAAVLLIIGWASYRRLLRAIQWLQGRQFEKEITERQRQFLRACAELKNEHRRREALEQVIDMAAGWLRADLGASPSVPIAALPDLARRKGVPEDWVLELEMLVREHDRLKFGPPQPLPYERAEAIAVGWFEWLERYRRWAVDRKLQQDD